MILALLWKSIPEGFILPRKWVKVRITALSSQEYLEVTIGKISSGKIVTQKNARCNSSMHIRRNSLITFPILVLALYEKGQGNGSNTSLSLPRITGTL